MDVRCIPAAMRSAFFKLSSERRAWIDLAAMLSEGQNARVGIIRRVMIGQEIRLISYVGWHAADG